MNRRISALPVVNEMNQVVDIYAKFDVIVSIYCHIVSSFIQTQVAFVKIAVILFVAGTVKYGALLEFCDRNSSW